MCSCVCLGCPCGQERESPLFGEGMLAEQTGGTRVYGQGVAGKKGRMNREKDQGMDDRVVGLGKWTFGKSVQGKRVG